MKLEKITNIQTILPIYKVIQRLKEICTHDKNEKPLEYQKVDTFWHNFFNFSLDFD